MSNYVKIQEGFLDGKGKEKLRYQRDFFKFEP